jgi:hypothetical protein
MPLPDDLSTLKDDMNAFILGHGLLRFSAYIPEEVQSIMWDAGDNPDAWKDFVELAKASGIAFLTVNDVALASEDLDILVERLQHSSVPDDDEIEDARWMRRFIGKVGFIQLGFSYQGSVFLYEVSTEWYDRYQQLLDSAEDFGSIILDEPGQEDER